MQGLSGLSALTPSRLVLDAGQAWFNIDVDALRENTTDPIDAATTNAIPLGATRGGATFNPNRTLRQVEVAGALGPVKGLRRREEVRPSLTVTFIEITPQNLLQAIAGASASVSQSGLYREIRGGPIRDEHYIPNVALLTTYAGTTRPLVIVLFNALVEESPDIATNDKDEVAIEVTFVGHFDPENLDEEPWAIFHPQAS